MATSTSDLYGLFRAHPHVSTDTRKLEPGAIFFALRGANFDGNRFIPDALAKGAVAAVSDDAAIAASDARILPVDDTLTALQELAREHRRALGIPILAISGSSGKTTTKELVSRVLAERFEVYATHGNLNNHIGVPLTLLAMTSETEFGIVEMGASACGEIARLAEIAEPDYGLLTNIGRAHLEGFGGPEGVLRGKGELFDFLAVHGGRAFVRADDDTLATMAAEREPLAVEYYPSSLADGIESRLEGGYPDDAIRRAVASYTPDNFRSQRIVTPHNTVIADCYNANPTSMRAALENIASEPLDEQQHRVLILGDMLELGDWSQSEHETVIEQAARIPGAELILVGGEFAAAYAALADKPARTMLCPSQEELRHLLQATPVEHALVLVKGSHGIGLEKVLDLL